MTLKIIDRINKIRSLEDVNKSQFERRINKSTGYLNMLEKKNGQPGVDVVLDIIKSFPDYNLTWLMTGEEPMKKNEHKHHVSEEPKAAYDTKSNSLILAMRDDLKNDLKELTQGMVTNFEVLGRGMKRNIMDQQKILKFIEALNAEEISKATKDLHLFLNDKKQ